MYNVCTYMYMYIHYTSPHYVYIYKCWGYLRVEVHIQCMYIDGDP